MEILQTININLLITSLLIFGTICFFLKLKYTKTPEEIEFELRQKAIDKEREEEREKERRKIGRINRTNEKIIKHKANYKHQMNNVMVEISIIENLKRNNRDKRIDNYFEYFVKRVNEMKNFYKDAMESKGLLEKFEEEVPEVNFDYERFQEALKIK